MILAIIQNLEIYLLNICFSKTMFFPSEYDLRILYDKNKNGIWDPGQFFGKRVQPEIVIPVERKISVKPAWQNEFEIAL